MIQKCIIPAAGRGTRWYPITKAIPKELLPILNKPVINYVLEEIINSRIKYVAIVINKKKRLIRDYIVNNTNFEKKANIKFFYQERPLGFGDAILKCRNFCEGYEFAVVLPDDIFIYNKPPLIKLIDIFKKYQTSIFGLSYVPLIFSYLYGRLDCLKINKYVYKVKKVYKRRKKKLASGNKKNVLCGVGRYIFTKEVFDLLTKIKKDGFKGELDDEKLFKKMLDKKENIYGVLIKDKRFDIGNIDGFIQANNKFYMRLQSDNTLSP